MTSSMSVGTLRPPPAAPRRELQHGLRHLPVVAAALAVTVGAVVLASVTVSAYKSAAFTSRSIVVFLREKSSVRFGQI